MQLQLPDRSTDGNVLRRELTRLQYPDVDFEQELRKTIAGAR